MRRTNSSVRWASGESEPKGSDLKSLNERSLVDKNGDQKEYRNSRRSSPEKVETEMWVIRLFDRSLVIRKSIVNLNEQMKQRVQFVECIVCNSGDLVV